MPPLNKNFSNRCDTKAYSRGDGVFQLEHLIHPTYLLRYSFHAFFIPFTVVLLLSSHSCSNYVFCGVYLTLIITTNAVFVWKILYGKHVAASVWFDFHGEFRLLTVRISLSKPFETCGSKTLSFSLGLNVLAIGLPMNGSYLRIGGYWSGEGSAIVTFNLSLSIFDFSCFSLPIFRLFTSPGGF